MMNNGVLFQVMYKGKIIDVYGFVGIGNGAHFIYYDEERNRFDNVLVNKCSRA